MYKPWLIWIAAAARNSFLMFIFMGIKFLQEKKSIKKIFMSLNFSCSRCWYWFFLWLLLLPCKKKSHMCLVKKMRSMNVKSIIRMNELLRHAQHWDTVPIFYSLLCLCLDISISHYLTIAHFFLQLVPLS